MKLSWWEADMSFHARRLRNRLRDPEFARAYREARQQIAESTTAWSQQQIGLGVERAPVTHEE